MAKQELRLSALETTVNQIQATAITRTSMLDILDQWELAKEQRKIEAKEAAKEQAKLAQAQAKEAKEAKENEAAANKKSSPKKSN